MDTFNQSWILTERFSLDKEECWLKEGDLIVGDTGDTKQQEMENDGNA